ncbi:MAG: hydantoinase/oxoprolinase family protein [Armatimonadota bacterium]|nr:hydantoinase/oxoprolinase family protein [Armatimonadota bacterium]
MTVTNGEARIGIEIGGTFTDWVVTEGDRVVRIGKVFSTPAHPEVGVMNALAEAGIGVEHLTTLVHGSTIATNVVVERKGAVTALLTTAGFRDVIAIQRQAKQRLFDLFYKHPEPLVPRHRVLEVSEKIGPDGSVRQPLSLDGLLDRLDRLIQEDGIESVAVCLLHAYANPEHEVAVERAIAARFPGLHVSLSSDVLPRFREYERASTVVMSAYTRPVVDRYLGSLEQRLAEAGFRGRLSIIQANGGSVPALAIRRHAVKMILSGPAAGVVGATAIAADAGLKDIITFDMGGTSTDVCLVDGGEPKVTSDYKIAGLPLALPMIDIVTVGAGGGSIASIDQGGIMQVGPASAGADPGPACYGRGGHHFTVTDANVILGFIRPHTFYGGRLRLDMDAARAALDRLAAQVGMPPLEAAEGVRRLVNFTMAQAMRLVSIERGHDPRDYAVVAYGGGGPLHAAQLADELGCAQVLVPHNPGIISAFGLLIADTQQDFLVTRIMPAGDATRQTLLETFADLEARARAEFDSYGVPWPTVERGYALDMRYVGQAYELTMPVDDFISGPATADQLVPRFHEFHRARYGHASSREGVEIANFRLTAVHRSTVRRVSAAPSVAADRIVVEEAPVRLNGRERACLFYRRESLPPATAVAGPAVVEEGTATTFVPEGWTGTIDRHGNLFMRRT